MWQSPWGYREGWTIVAGLILAGLALQLSIGLVPDDLPALPVAIAVTLLSVLAGLWHRTGIRAGRSLALFFSGHVATITSVSAFLTLSLVMGLFAQVPASEARNLPDLLYRLGTHTVLGTFAFGFVYLYLIFVLGAVTVRRIIVFRPTVKDFAFVLNHLGLFLFLVAAYVSTSEMERYTMVLEEGAVEWRGTNLATGETEELPIALELIDFRMDEYPPKVMILDGVSGELLPKGAPGYVSAESLPASAVIGEWELTIEQYIPLASPTSNADLPGFAEYRSEGGAPAVFVRAKSQKTGTELSGWVSCGSYLLPYAVLPLEDNLSVVMPAPEPKQYFSETAYYLQSGEKGEARISVNSPLIIRDWYIYQLNYDQEKGRWGTTSVVELVKDPYILPVYIGIALLLLGACLLIFAPPLSEPRSDKQPDSL